MDPRVFRTGSPGELVKIPNFGGWAYLPGQMPCEWEFPTQLWPLLADVKHTFGELEGIGKVLPNANLILKPLRNREALDSSTIEGTYSSAKDMLLFEMQHSSKGELTDPTKEVVNYSLALEKAINVELPLNLDTILEMHRILLSGTRGEEKKPGEFRKQQVGIGTGYRYVPPPHDRIPKLLKNFSKSLNATSAYDPLIDTFIQHYQFEAIHPFLDGNGRVGRAFMALSIYRRCRFTKPWIYLSRYFEKHREIYMRTLMTVSTHGNWTNWVEFCLKACLSQAEAAIRSCQSMVALRQEFEERIATSKASYRLLQILNLIFDQQIITVSATAKELEVTYPTASADIQKLVKLKIIKEFTTSKPKTFFSPELFKVAYGDGLKLKN